MGRYATGDGAAAPRVQRALTAGAGGLLHRSAAVAECWSPTPSAASPAARLARSDLWPRAAGEVLCALLRATTARRHITTPSAQRAAMLTQMSAKIRVLG
jgi:hypothetical protein